MGLLAAPQAASGEGQSGMGSAAMGTLAGSEEDPAMRLWRRGVVRAEQGGVCDL